MTRREIISQYIYILVKNCQRSEFNKKIIFLVWVWNDWRFTQHNCCHGASRKVSKQTNKGMVSSMHIFMLVYWMRRHFGWLSTQCNRVVLSRVIISNLKLKVEIYNIFAQQNVFPTHHLLNLKRLDSFYTLLLWRAQCSITFIH